MGFKLTNTGKIILSERFHLVEGIEDEMQDLCQKILAKIEQEVTTLNNKDSLNDASSKALAQISDRAGMLLRDMEDSSKVLFKAKDPAIVKAKTTEFVKNTEKLFSTVNTDTVSSDFSKARDYFDEISDLANSSDFSKKTIAELKEKISQLRAILAKLIKQSRLVLSGKEEISKGDYMNALNHAYADIKKLNSMISAGAPEATSEGMLKVLNEISDSMTQDKIGLFIELVENAHNGEFGKVIARSEYGDDDTSDLNDLKAKQTDWAAEFEATTNKEAFWDRYYTTYWGENAPKIKALGEAFRQECQVLGFTEDTNQFIKFLNTFLVKKGYPITRVTYNVIHDAIAVGSRGITLKDLENAAKAPEKSGSIIACRDFYSKDASTAREYVRTLAELKAINISEINAARNAKLNLSTKEDTDERFLNVTKFLNKNSSGGTIDDPSYVVWVLLYETSQTVTAMILKGDKKVEIDAEPVEKLALRKLTDIKSLLSTINIDINTTAAKNWNGAEDADKLALYVLADSSLGGPATAATAQMKERAEQIIVYLASMYIKPTDLVKFLQTTPPSDLSTIALNASTVALVKANIDGAGVGGDMNKKELTELIEVFKNKGLLA